MRVEKLPPLLLCVCGLILGASVFAGAQTVTGVCAFNAPPPPKTDPLPPETTSGIRIAVTGRDGKPLQRKRFYLVERSITADSNFNPASAPRRDQFLSGASPELRAWLKEHDCESLYCPEYEAAYENAVKSVPEFQRAYQEGMKKYKTHKLALSWVTTTFPLKNVRTDFYKRKKEWLDQASQKAGKVMSVMTDEKGVAYFTDIKLRSYFISNLIPLEDGGILWNCDVTVPPPVPRQLYSVSLTLSAPK
jgi:hypothetical protein